MTIRVLVADDHPIVRVGLIGLLTAEPGIEVVGEADDGATAVDVAARTMPDVVLMDLRMPVLDGVAATTAILGGPEPRPRVVVLTTYETDTDILRAVEAGATGYLLKGTTREELIAGVRAAAEGRAALAPSVATRLISSMQATDRLSAREVEVLGLVARGYSNAAVGAQLFIAEATVKTHLVRAFGKLGVDDRTHAVTVARERGYLT